MGLEMPSWVNGVSGLKREGKGGKSVNAAMQQNKILNTLQQITEQEKWSSNMFIKLVSSQIQSLTLEGLDKPTLNKAEPQDHAACAVGGGRKCWSEPRKLIQCIIMGWVAQGFAAVTKVDSGQQDLDTMYRPFDTK